MSEPTYLTNGRFLHDLGGWNATSAAYAAGDGDDHYGVAVLATGGGSVSQQFSVSGTKLFTVHLSVKAVGSSLSSTQAQLVIIDGAGNTVVTQNLSGTADVWTEQTYMFGLTEGTTYSLKVINNSAASDVKIDDVWLWFVVMTRAAIATRVHTKLGRLATDRSYSTTPAGSLTEGSYTYAIDAGLRAVGAINPETDEPDVRYMTAASLDTLLNEVEGEMLEQLQRDYAVATDIKVGQREEKLSQVSAAIGKLKGTPGAGGGGKVVTRKLIYQAGDYEFH